MRACARVALCLGLASQAAAAADPVLVIHGGAGRSQGRHPAGRGCDPRRPDPGLWKGPQRSRRKAGAGCGHRRDHRARGRSAVQRRQGRGVHPRRQERARCLDHGRRDPARGRGRQRAPRQEPDPAGAGGDGAFPARDAGGRRRRGLREGAGHRAGGSRLLPHRTALEAAAGGAEGCRRRLGMRDPEATTKAFPAPSARWRSMPRATWPRAPRPAA